MADNGSRHKAMRASGWNIGGVSVAGSGHIKAGQPCQDAFAMSSTNGWVVLTLADGAGSARMGGRGAAMAVRRSALFLKRRLSIQPNHCPLSQRSLSTLLKCAVKDCHEHLKKRAGLWGMSIRDLSSTLLMAVMNHEQAAVAQIGDGAIVAWMRDGFVPLTHPQHGAHANETSMVTGKTYLDSLQVVVCPETVQGIAMLSDGLEYLTLQRGVPHAPFFLPVFRFLEKFGQDRLCEELIRWFKGDAVLRRTDDDKTLVLASR
jgi:hypothetical protein